MERLWNTHNEGMVGEDVGSNTDGKINLFVRGRSTTTFISDWKHYMDFLL